MSKLTVGFMIVSLVAGSLGAAPAVGQDTAAIAEGPRAERLRLAHRPPTKRPGLSRPAGSNSYFIRVMISNIPGSIVPHTSH